ncbi:Uncharacterised protein [Vibrio cholerae]|nr:Uncharacterised protein [Vibrio cholerae]
MHHTFCTNCEQMDLFLKLSHKFQLIFTAYHQIPCGDCSRIFRATKSSSDCRDFAICSL